MAHQVLSLRLLSRAEEEGLCLLCLNRQPGGNQAQVMSHWPPFSLRTWPAQDLSGQMEGGG